MNCPECGEAFGDTCSEYIDHVVNGTCKMNSELIKRLPRFCTGCGKELSSYDTGVDCHLCEVRRAQFLLSQLQAKIDFSQLRMDLASSIMQHAVIRGDWPPKYWKG